MKKTVAVLTAIFLAAFIVIISINAQDKPQDSKKATTEVSKQCPKGPSASGCCKMNGSTSETRPCGKAQCSEAQCDQPKCSQGACKAKSDATGCPKRCSKTASEKGSSE